MEKYFPAEKYLDLLISKSKLLIKHNIFCYKSCLWRYLFRSFWKIPVEPGEVKALQAIKQGSCALTEIVIVRECDYFN